MMEIICYACGRGENPENTLEGIAHCQKVNPDWRIEMDLQLTSDGEIVLFHDKNALRTTGKDLEISKTTLSDIKKLDAGFSSTQTGNEASRVTHDIPTLRQVFEQYPNLKVVLDIHADRLQAVDRTLELIAEFEVQHNVVLVSQYDHMLAYAKEKMSTLTFGVASKEAKRIIYSSFLRLDGFFPIKNDILMIPLYYGRLRVLTERIVKHLQKRERKVWAWMLEGRTVETVNSVTESEFLRKAGANGIFTEYLGRLNAELRQKPRKTSTKPD